MYQLSLGRWTLAPSAQYIAVSLWLTGLAVIRELWRLRLQSEAQPHKNLNPNR